MALLLKNSVFLHIPKTGGNYVQAILERIMHQEEWAMTYFDYQS